MKCNLPIENIGQTLHSSSNVCPHNLSIERHGGPSLTLGTLAVTLEDKAR